MQQLLLLRARGTSQKKKEQSLNLSEQQIIDCTPPPAIGCEGGDFILGFRYMQHHKVCTEESYEFTTKQGESESCQTSCEEAIPAGGVTGFRAVKQYDPQALMAAVSRKPVAVAIDASNPYLSLYKEGVWSDCGTSLDHAVLLVGYGSEDGKDYWLIQNSWGTGWGQGGYGKILRTSSRGPGTCGILQHAAYPTLKIESTMDWMAIALFAGVVCFACAVCVFMCCCINKCRKRSRGRTTPILATQSLQHVPAVVAVPVVAVPVNRDDPNINWGNSRQSRLLN